MPHAGLDAAGIVAKVFEALGETPARRREPAAAPERGSLRASGADAAAGRARPVRKPRAGRRRRSRPASSRPTASRVRKASETLPGDAAHRGRAGPSLCLARRRQARRRARSFGIDPSRAGSALDVGASTGGFTDVLLQRGARRVYAVDVGRGQLHAAPARRARVVCLEGTDARRLDARLIPEPVDLVVVDVSFISLRLVLPPVLALASPGAELVVLVKPQFEAGRGRVGKGGIVRDAAVHAEVCAAHRRACRGPRLDRSAASRRRRSPAATAIASSCWRRRLPEAAGSAAIARDRAPRPPWRRRRRRAGLRALHAARRDGRGRGRRRPRPARRRDDAEPGPGRAVLPLFRRLRGLRHPALAAGALPRLEARPAWSRPCAQAGLDGRSRRSSTPMAPGAAAPPSMPAPAASALPRRAAIASSISPRARSSCLALAKALPAARASPGRWPRSPSRSTSWSTATATGIDLDVRGAGRVGEALRRRLAELAAEHDLARLSNHGDVVIARAGRRRSGSAAHGSRRRPAPSCRRRSGGRGAGRARRAPASARAGASPTCSAGCGTFALVLAERSTVSAFDADRAALAALRQAARAGATGLRPITAGERDLFRRPLLTDELKAFDAVVFDPPRAGRRGAGAPARRLQRCRRVVAVSCNARPSPATPRSSSPAASLDAGHAGRPVPPLGPCRDRRRLRALTPVVSARPVLIIRSSQSGRDAMPDISAAPHGAHRHGRLGLRQDRPSASVWPSGSAGRFATATGFIRPRMSRRCAPACRSPTPTAGPGSTPSQAGSTPGAAPAGTASSPARP